MQKHGICIKLKFKSITIFVKRSDEEISLIQVSFINQRLGVMLSTTQRTDYFWTLGQVRVKNVCFVA